MGLVDDDLSGSVAQVREQKLLELGFCESVVIILEFCIIRGQFIKVTALNRASVMAEAGIYKILHSPVRNRSCDVVMLLILATEDDLDKKAPRRRKRPS